MNLKAPQVLAADTNVGMDLAQGNDWVLDSISTIRRRLPDSSLLIPPTVSEELAWLAVHEMMARHKANHIHVVYAPDAKKAHRACRIKAAMLSELGLEVHFCGNVDVP